MRSEIVPGNAFPDYQLPDHTRTLRKLSELQGDDPLILTLARGNYCPKEHHQHLELASFFPKIAVGYTPIASLIGHSGSSAFRPTTTTAASMSLTGSCFSSESAPGPSIMGVEDEADQSTKRPCR